MPVLPQGQIQGGGGWIRWLATPFGEAKITKIAKFGAKRQITYNILTYSLVADCISHPPLKHPASAPARGKGVMKLTLCEAPTREKRQTRIQELRALCTRLFDKCVGSLTSPANQKARVLKIQETGSTFYGPYSRIL